AVLMPGSSSVQGERRQGLGAKGRGGRSFGRGLALQMRFPLLDRELLKEMHCRIQLRDDGIEMLLVALLLGFHREAVLLEERPHQDAVRHLEERVHEPARKVQRQKRDLEGLKVKQKEGAGGALVDRQ